MHITWWHRFSAPTRAPFQKAGSGFWQRAHNGSRSVPPFSGAPVPQRS